jgi:hypothetical protein
MASKGAASAPAESSVPPTPIRSPLKSMLSPIQVQRAVLHNNDMGRGAYTSQPLPRPPSLRSPNRDGLRAAGSPPRRIDVGQVEALLDGAQHRRLARSARSGR